MFADLIGTAYEAALQPDGWTQVLEGIADAIRADSAVLMFTDQISGEGRMLTTRTDPAATPVYFEHYAARNPVRPQRNRALGLWRDPLKWRSTVLTDEHALPKSEFMRSEYYGDFLRPLEMHSLLMAGLAMEGTRFASLTLTRPARRGQFGSAEMEIVHRLQPHLIRAFELGLKLRDLNRTGEGIAEFLDRSPQAVFLTDAAARVCYINPAAEALVEARAGLGVSSGLLCATDAHEGSRLRAAIALAGAADRDRRTGSAFSLSRPRARPLPVIIAPLRSERFALFSPEPLVLICASDPDSGATMPGERLRRLYGFTPAEAKIAIELALGHDPKSIADRQSLSIHTVRVHIARIFAKTETSRQADLVRLLERVCGVWVDLSGARPRS